MRPMAKKKPPKTLQRHRLEPALSGIGFGSLVRIVLLAALGIGGAVVALWVHYRKPYVPPAPTAAPSASDGIQYIEIDVDASVLP